MMPGKVLKVSCRYLPPFSSYQENQGGVESAPPPLRGHVLAFFPMGGHKNKFFRKRPIALFRFPLQTTQIIFSENEVSRFEEYVCK